MRKYTTNKTLADTITERNATAKAKVPTQNTKNIPSVEKEPLRINKLKEIFEEEDFQCTANMDIVPRMLTEKTYEHFQKGDLRSAVLALEDGINWFKRNNTSYNLSLESVLNDCLDLSFKDFLDTPLEEREKHPHMRVLKLVLTAQAARELASFYPMPPPMIEEDINKIFNPYAFERELIAKVHYSLVPDRRVSPKMHYEWVRKFRTLGRKLHLEGYKALELPSDSTVSGNTELVYLDNERLDEPRVTL